MKLLLNQLYHTFDIYFSVNDSMVIFTRGCGSYFIPGMETKLFLEDCFKL